MCGIQRKVEILEEAVGALERGMSKLHYQMINEGLDPSDDLHILAGYELEILTEILGKAKATIKEGEVSNE